jgi:hypothetical protein
MNATAWLLTLDGGLHVAVGERELMHIVSDEVERVFVPRTPVHTSELIVWQNRLLPLFNVAAALREEDTATEATAEATQRGGTIIVIAAYQASSESQVEFGALPVRGLPERIEVDDDSGCELPSDPPGWRRFAHSCCEHERHGAVPILDLHRMFAPDDNRNHPFERSTQW